MKNIFSKPRKSTLLFKLIICTVLLAGFWSSPSLAAASETAAAEVSTGIDGAPSAQTPLTADLVPEPVQIDDAVQPTSDVGAAETESATPDDSTPAASAGQSGSASDPVAPETTQPQPAATAGGSENTTGSDSAACCDTDQYLELICGTGSDVYWASMDDYNASLLSINYRLTNTSTTDLYQVRVTEATATKNVKIDTPLPLMLGDLSPGELINFTLKWLIPKGVRGFQTDISICTDFEPLCEGPECDPDPPCEGPECNPEPVCEGPECDPEPEPLCEGSGCTPTNNESEFSDPVVNSDLAAFHASTLPNTGFSMTTALIFCFGMILPVSLLLTIASKLVAARRK
ncbi:MAG: hypothetical protein Q7K29_01535 [Thermoleophilia bacterium]|nr:hypothetical protein [Thermoleophilia bacterium]